MVATDSVEKIISAIEKFDRLGFDCVEIASLSPDQMRFMSVFKDRVATHFN